MNIEKKQELNDFLEFTLDSISLSALPEHSHPCPHCNYMVRYPTIARQRDIDDFHMIMESASKVMERHGITANLLADVFAECHIAMASQKAKREGG